MRSSRPATVYPVRVDDPTTITTSPRPGPAVDRCCRAPWRPSTATLTSVVAGAVGEEEVGEVVVVVVVETGVLSIIKRRNRRQ